MDIKPIRTREDHARALRDIERLWDKAEPGSAEGDEFEILATLVDAFEREHFVIPAPDPVEAIRFRMEQKGLANKDLLPIFRTRARVSEIMQRRRRLNLAMIRGLHERLSIPFESLVQEYALRRPPRPRSTTRASRKASASPKR